MKAQFKYSLRAYLTPRAIALSVALAMNMVFGLLGYYNIYGHSGKVTAVVFCSLALCGILAICIYTDVEMLRGMCTAPAGYITTMTPVKSWKIILARITTILVEDILFFIIGISGIVLQAFILDGHADKFWSGFDRDFLWVASIIILGYIYLITIVLFCFVLSKSIFYGLRAGTFLAVLTMFVTAYLFNLLNFALAPFGGINNVGIFYNVSLIAGPNLGFLAYILLCLCKSAALFLTSSYLMERKINI